MTNCRPQQVCLSVMHIP